MTITEERMRPIVVSGTTGMYLAIDDERMCTAGSMMIITAAMDTRIGIRSVQRGKTSGSHALAERDVIHRTAAATSTTGGRAQKNAIRGLATATRAERAAAVTPPTNGASINTTKGTGRKSAGATRGRPPLGIRQAIAIARSTASTILTRRVHTRNRLKNQSKSLRTISNHTAAPSKTRATSTTTRTWS